MGFLRVQSRACGRIKAMLVCAHVCGLRSTVVCANRGARAGWPTGPIYEPNDILNVPEKLSDRPKNVSWRLAQDFWRHLARGRRE